jgi:hypothetical protein
MKYIFRILLALFLLPSVIMAKNVHLRVLVFGDTNDSSIGQSVATDIDAYKKLVLNVKAAVEPEGVKTTFDVFSGDNCSYDKLNEYLEDFSCNGDIVLFIYNGHGGRSHKDESKFPRMCLGSNYESKWMKISDLNDKLRNKNPRLMVVVTDCCNSYYDRRGDDNESAYGITSNQSNGDGLRQLFLHYKGEVCITAASPGEYGWGTTQGGMLSLNFLDVIYKFDAKGNSANWNDFMRVVTENTYNNSLEFYNNRWISNTQRPVYDVKVSKSDFANIVDDNDSDNDDIVDDSDDDESDFEDDDLYEEDDLYEDDADYSEISLGKALGHSFWIVLVGLLFLWIPKFLNLTGNSANVIRVIGLVFIVWAVISFFSSL